jgi:hypothetical protein
MLLKIAGRDIGQLTDLDVSWASGHETGVTAR